MKIAYILSPINCNPQNGIRIQAEAWKRALTDIGHEVEFPSLMDIANFDKFDIIHIFGNGLDLISYTNAISRYNSNIAVSPIIDSYKPVWQYKIVVNTSFPALRIFSINGALKDIKAKVAKVFVRSQHEFNYIHKAYKYPESKIAKVMLAHRMPSNINPEQYSEKDNYCFHISSIYQKRKNVLRLIEAAKKYGFKLVLAGDCGTETQFKPLREAINNAANITVLGRITEEELINHYRKAKVFALPSLEEGVGQVALEAACYGCNIVITNLGGPKEYYNGLARTVNPIDIDDIGLKIKEAMLDPVNFEVARYIAENYNRDVIAKRLIEEYSSMLI